MSITGTIIYYSWLQKCEPQQDILVPQFKKTYAGLFTYESADDYLGYVWFSSYGVIKG